MKSLPTSIRAPLMKKQKQLEQQREQQRMQQRNHQNNQTEEQRRRRQNNRWETEQAYGIRRRKEITDARAKHTNQEKHSPFCQMKAGQTIPDSNNLRKGILLEEKLVSTQVRGGALGPNGEPLPAKKSVKYSQQEQDSGINRRKYLIIEDRFRCKLHNMFGVPLLGKGQFGICYLAWRFLPKAAFDRLKGASQEEFYDSGLQSFRATKEDIGRMQLDQSQEWIKHKCCVKISRRGEPSIGVNS